MCHNKDLLYAWYKFIQTHNVLKEDNNNIFCIPESFNIKILHQLLDYWITFVNSKNENTNSRGNLVLKNRFKRLL